MAAISTLMIEDPALTRENYDEERTPTTPRQVQRHATPITQDTKVTHQPVAVTSTGPSMFQSGLSALSNANGDNSNMHADGNGADAMDIDNSDMENDGSDNDTEQGDGTGSSRKKKGQRFFCTGYPPCNLSFTRSEHLARHIRKHTGERPFQCHCNRRFSRLDNLRQHAQTVHVNEEIPTDSLAATGTRYQRQIRTDRVRPAGRPRTNTMSSTGSHSRGHSRNLSASSVGSTSSNYSTATDVTRRRPPPLLMAGEGRPKVGVDPPNTPPPQFASYATNSPGDLGTPSSATFPATPGSSGFGSVIGSPLLASSRAGLYGPSRTPGRRLSVPSAPPPYQAPYSVNFVTQYPNQGHSSTHGGPPNSGPLISPTSSTFSSISNIQAPPGEDWRRRTWHPSTYANFNFNYSRPATSGLTYSQTPDAPQPAYAQNATAAAGHAPRLPGIESFDQVQHRPSTPPRRNPTSPGIEGGNQFTLMPAPDIDVARHGNVTWESVRRSNYPDLDDHSERNSSSWGQQTIEQIQNVGARANQNIQYPPMGPPPATNPNQQQQVVQDVPQSQTTNHRSKRHGWYGMASQVARTSPEDSSSSDGVPTPGTSTAEIHPAIMHVNGYIEPQHAIVSVDAHNNPCLPTPMHMHSDVENSNSSMRTSAREHRDSTNSMNRLEALVAVATSENSTARSVR